MSEIASPSILGSATYWNSGSSMPSRARWLRIRAIQARSSSSLRALASDSIGWRRVTLRSSETGSPPPRRGVEPAEVGEVEVHRRDRDTAGGDRGQIRAGLVGEAGIGAVDPVLARAVLVLGVELELVAVDALAQARDLDADCVAGGDVDVQQRALWAGHLVEVGDHPPGELGR